MTHSRSEIQLIICADLTRLFIDRQIDRYINSQEQPR